MGSVQAELWEWIDSTVAHLWSVQQLMVIANFRSEPVELSELSDIDRIAGR